MIRVDTGPNNRTYIEMDLEEMQALRTELHTWDGVTPLSEVLAEILEQLMALP